MTTKFLLPKHSLIAGAALFMFACSEAPVTDTEITQAALPTETERAQENIQVAKVREIFHAVPSPMDMAAVLKESGTKYEVDLLNDVKNVHDYSTSRSRALNLGIYGADLSYASIFNQNQESILYISCTKKLSDHLGLSRAFDDQSIERMETNVDNRDSLLNIISQTYYTLDAYLKENERDHVSAMIIAAGWIEGLYLATSVTQEALAANDKLRRRIAEQKMSLDNLIALVDSYNKDGMLDDIRSDLGNLLEAYEGVHISRERNTKTQADDGTTVIGGRTTIDMSDESLAKITEAVREIRTRYIAV